jgi:hypothetical protein
MSNKKCIIVLGTHRSGASALTKVLHKCGIYLGTTRPATSSAQKENFENLKLYNFNVELLAKYHFTWSDLVCDIDFSADDVEKLKQLLISEFDGKGVFAIKEPTMIYLFPLYAKALSDLDIEINFLLLYRNPLEVAAALNLKDGFSKDKGLFIWTYNFLLAEKYSREYTRALVRFDELIDYTSAVVFKIGKMLNIEVEVSEQLDGYLQSRFKYRHLEDELNQYASLGLPTIVGQIRHFGDGSQTMLYDELLTNILQKVRFINNIGMNHSDYWSELAHASLGELEEIRIQWQIKDQKLQALDIALQQKDSELEVRDIELVKREKLLADKDRELQQKNTALKNLEDSLQDLSIRLEHKRGELEEQANALLIKENIITTKDEGLQSKDTELKNLEQSLEAKETDLQFREYELQAKDQIVLKQLSELQAEHLELQVSYQQLLEKVEGKKTWLGRMFMRE